MTDKQAHKSVRISTEPDSDQKPPEVKTSVPTGTRILDPSVLASMRIPQLPPFSGENQKGDVSFEVWKYELHCLIRDAVYPNTLILLAVRRSLKGRARDILLTVGESATPSDILAKLEGIYGNVSSSEVLLQQFYLESQKADETVADYSIRIENLLRRATQKRIISESIRNEMLCSKLWNGLKDPLLKNSSRYKYDTEKDFNNLRKEIRSIEQDLSTSTTSSIPPRTKEATHLQQASQDAASSKQLGSILDEMKMMRQRLDSIERKYREASARQPSSSSAAPFPNPASSQRGFTPRGRGGGFQQRGRDRGRGGRGFNTYYRGGRQNLPKSDSDPKPDKQSSLN